MPPRSVKMKRRILGFQRRVWWPKWTPASSRSRMETTGMVLAFGFGLRVCRRGADGTGTRAGTRRPGWSTGSSGLRAPDSLAGAPQCGLQVVRERRGRLDPLARDRMRERQPRGVQELALQVQVARTAVDGVAGDREVDRRQVHADLVRATGLQRDAQERVLRQELGHLEVRHRLARRIRVERVARGVVAVAADRRLDPAGARARAAVDERQV